MILSQQIIYIDKCLVFIPTQTMIDALLSENVLKNIVVILFGMFQKLDLVLH